MQLLIDTHVLIWWWGGDDRLPNRLRDLLAAQESTVYVSAIVGLELAIKVRLGKLPALASGIGDYRKRVKDDGFYHLNVHEQHAVRAGLLPGEHRDPFDRVLAAQALYDGLPIMTVDREIAAFGCEVLW